MKNESLTGRVGFRYEDRGYGRGFSDSFTVRHKRILAFVWLFAFSILLSVLVARDVRLNNRILAGKTTATIFS